MTYFNNVSIGDGGYLGKTLEISPMGNARVSQVSRLVGTVFTGTTVDSNFWSTAGTANNGTSTWTGGTAILATNTTANGTAVLQSARTARYISGASNFFRAVLQCSAGATDNTRRRGAFDGTDGAYFQFSGTTFSVVTLKASSATVVSSGFNGNLGSTYSLDTNAHTFEIYYVNKTVYFTIDDVLLHKVTASAATWTGTMHLPVRLDNTNANGATSNNTITCRVASINRLGQLETQKSSKIQAGTTAANVMKYGPGNLHGIVISNVTSGAVITVWDNTAGSGTTIWTSTLTFGNQGGSGIYSIDMKGIPFFTGLTVSVATQNATVMCLYE